MNLLRLQNVSYSWQSRQSSTAAVKDVSAEFHSDSINFLCGASGSGKTSLALLCAGLVKPDSGDVKYHLATASKRIALVFQFPETLFLEETVKAEFESIHGKSADSTASEWLSKLGLDYQQLAERHTSKLSSAEGRLTAIALQISREPELLILDEPTIGLDSKNRSRLINCLKSWISSDRLVIIITHDLDLMEKLGGKTFILRGGRMAKTLATKDLLSNHQLLDQFELK